MWRTFWVGMIPRATSSQLDLYIAPFLEDLEILFRSVSCGRLGLQWRSTSLLMEDMVLFVQSWGGNQKLLASFLFKIKNVVEFDFSPILVWSGFCIPQLEGICWVDMTLSWVTEEFLNSFIDHKSVHTIHIYIHKWMNKKQSI